MIWLCIGTSTFICCGYISVPPFRWVRIMWLFPKIQQSFDCQNHTFWEIGQNISITNCRLPSSIVFYYYLSGLKFFKRRLCFIRCVLTSYVSKVYNYVLYWRDKLHKQILLFSHEHIFCECSIVILQRSNSRISHIWTAFLLSAYQVYEFVAMEKI